MHAVHVSPYVGTWYPDCRTDLERLLDDLFETSAQRTGAFLFANPLGFVVPHAGLQYSGAVAAAAYRHVRRRQPRRAVVLGFAHRGGPPGVSIPDIDEYETPLGEVAVDRQTMERLASHRPFRFVAEDRICDHSVEIQLPLLQHAAPHARVVPLFAGHLDPHERDAAAETLAALCGPDTVFLVSSDLTHYGRAFGYQPFPADSKISRNTVSGPHKAASVSGFPGQLRSYALRAGLRLPTVPRGFEDIRAAGPARPRRNGSRGQPRLAVLP